MAAPAYRQWAHTTGGRFAVVSDGDADWAALHDRGIAALPGDPLAPASVAAWRELYAWCLAPALALLMAVSLPRRVVAMIALALWGAVAVPPPALADEAGTGRLLATENFAGAQALYAHIGYRADGGRSRLAAGGVRVGSGASLTPHPAAG